jgi:putative hydrolase of the HAD superfamily
VIDAVLLDVGGVFVMPDHQMIRDLVAAHGGTPEPGSLDHAHYEGIAAGEAAVARGEDFDWAEYRRAILLAAGLPEDQVEAASADLDAALSGPSVGVWKQRLTGAAEGLAQLAELDIPLAIVSNSDGSIETLLRELQLAHLRSGAGPAGVGTPMEIIIDSKVVGVEKPDPAIFAIALEATGTDPARTVHVGDTLYADVVGAFAAGLRPLHLDPIGWCKDDRHAHVTDLADVAELVASERET